MEDWTELNRAHWDEVTAIHVASPFYATNAFRRGENVLDPLAREAAGEVAGKRLLHLQCHFGLDTLSFARLGAEVTGLDFSSAAVSTARALAADAGIDAAFVECDVLKAPDDLTGFDIVFASWGAICWIPDLAAWMRVAARALRPGGRLILLEGHPMMLTMSGAEADVPPFRPMVAYETREPIMIEDAGDSAEPAATLSANRTAEWMHGIGRILNGAIAAGLTIRRFDELDRVPWRALSSLVEAGNGYWTLPRGAPTFPLAFCLEAIKS